MSSPAASHADSSAAAQHALGALTSADGLAWVAAVPPAALADAPEHDGELQLVVHEDGRPLGPPDCLHADIGRLGHGRFSHWDGHVWFSSSDGSDPATNGRSYSVAWTEDPRLLAALAHLRPDLPEARRDDVRACLRQVLRSGQIDTLSEVDARAPVAGRRVLEVGCGACWVAPFFLGAGAVHYHGVELLAPLHERRVFDRSHAEGMWTDDHYLPMPLSLAEYLDAFEAVDVTAADFTDTRLPGGSFDVVFLRVVSEHLLQPRTALREMHRLLRTGGRLFLTHGSYTSWNGHHVPPHSVAEYDPQNAAHRAVVDWAHLETLVSNDRDDGHVLNYLRLHELAGLLRAFFELERWELHPTSEACGAARFTPEIAARHPEYTRDEFLTDMAFATCRKTRDEPPASHGLAAQRPLPDAVARWLEHGGDLRALSRETGWPVFELVELKETERKRRDRD